MLGVSSPYPIYVRRVDLLPGDESFFRLSELSTWRNGDEGMGVIAERTDARGAESGGHRAFRQKMSSSGGSSGCMTSSAAILASAPAIRAMSAEVSYRSTRVETGHRFVSRCMTRLIPQLT